MSIEDPAAAPAAHTFKRSLSGFGVIVLTLSVLSPGVSIFVSGASLLQQAGTGVVIAFLIGALVCYCQTGLIAELGAAYPTAGYDYAAIGHALGDWAGATCYLASIIGIPLFLNISAAGIATYLHPLGLRQHQVARQLLLGQFRVDQAHLHRRDDRGQRAAERHLHHPGEMMGSCLFLSPL